MPVVENSEKISDSQKNELIHTFEQLLATIPSLERSNTKDNLFSAIDESQFEEINKIETIYAHLAIASYLESEDVRGQLAVDIGTVTAEAEVFRNLYGYEDFYVARLAFICLLYNCLDWLYNSIKWFCAFPIPDNSKEDLRSCPRELFEYAFNIYQNQAKEWNDNDEVATEVNIYLNLLIQQIYS